MIERAGDWRALTVSSSVSAVPSVSLVEAVEAQGVRLHHLDLGVGRRAQARQESPDQPEHERGHHTERDTAHPGALGRAFSLLAVEGDGHGFVPDLLHVHDWQTGMLPLFVRETERRYDVTLALKTVFTIHNIAYQGIFPRKSFPARFFTHRIKFPCLRSGRIIKAISRGKPKESC